jgi:hypothetical protein
MTQAEMLRKALNLARAASQDNPGFSIIDAKQGYARYPTPEEILLGKALLLLEKNVTTDFMEAINT